MTTRPALSWLRKGFTRRSRAAQTEYALTRWARPCTGADLSGYCPPVVSGWQLAWICSPAPACSPLSHLAHTGDVHGKQEGIPAEKRAPDCKQIRPSYCVNQSINGNWKCGCDNLHKKVQEHIYYLNKNSAAYPFRHFIGTAGNKMHH